MKVFPQTTAAALMMLTDFYNTAPLLHLTCVCVAHALLQVLLKDLSVSRTAHRNIAALRKIQVSRAFGTAPSMHG